MADRDDSGAAPPKAPQRGLSWLESGVLAETHIIPLVAGGPSEGHWLLDLFSQFPIPRLGAWLSLDCGAGELEFTAVQRGLLATLDGYDPSPEAVSAARAWADHHALPGIRFSVGAVPDIPLSTAAYDVVLSQMTLHRLADLGGFLDRIRSAMRPGGWLILNEYVGPRRQQFTNRQLAIVEELLAVIPPRLRLHRVAGIVKNTYDRIPIAHFEKHAPLESISSAEIVDAVATRFEVVARRDYGGAILSPLLDGIVGNFDLSRDEDVAILRLLSIFERILMREAALPSDFAVLVARTAG